jgi:ATP-dependent DNA helicase DinG
MNIRESGVAELLPTVQSVVFDEAHQLNEIGIQFLGRQLTTFQVDRYANDLASCRSHLLSEVVDWPRLINELIRSVAGLDILCRAGELDLRQVWFEDHPPGVNATTWSLALAVIHKALSQIEIILSSLEEGTPEFKGLRERASRLTAELNVFSQPVQEGWVRWIEMGERLKLFQSPLDIADTMRSKILPVRAGFDGGSSVIFTSATLGHDATLAQFLESCGLQEAEVLQVQSPFDYKSQAAMYVPANMPKPSMATHSERVADLVIKGATILGGRTLVLTTTLRAMNHIAERLRQPRPELFGIEVLLQGESSKRELTERFRNGLSDDAKGIILVATASFWEGIDVPGDALQMVVIDKLPFPSPNDPMVAARSRNIERKGKNSFQYLHIAQATIALKQGAGRLIRRETDRGILVVCDIRLTQMGYGRRILAALPAMKMIKSEDEFFQELNALTTPSTKAR